MSHIAAQIIGLQNLLSPTNMAFILTKFLILSVSLYTLLRTSAISQTSPSTRMPRGEWRLLQPSIGISAMHMQLLHDNKVIIFDRTDFGKSNLSLPGGHCRHDSHDRALKIDCTAHSALYDIATNSFRPLMVQTDTWCSSGSVLRDGTLVQTGGYNDGDHVIRTFTPCEGENCEWIEIPHYLSERRWYASNQILPDGRIIIVGGRGQFNYEFYPSDPSHHFYYLQFLADTRDGRSSENNLYPFLHLLPDGNLFIFANTRSILLDYNRNYVIREYPRMARDVPRNYPSTGSSVLLPLDENNANIEAEIMICGGARRDSYRLANRRTFVSATSSCGRLVVTDQNPTWFMETMPTSRVMSDMLLLPSREVIIINGAQLGTAGYENARDPIMQPVLYRPYNPRLNRRFRRLASSSRPRMYHSSAILLPDGRVLVGGNNPHPGYSFTRVLYPTDLSLEVYSPPYLSDRYASTRPSIVSIQDKTLDYGQSFLVRFHVQQYVPRRTPSVRIIAPSFTTHSFSMNQRMVVLKRISITHESDRHNLTVVAPSRAEIAPPGYYLLFVAHSGIPSSGEWVKVG